MQFQLDIDCHFLKMTHTWISLTLLLITPEFLSALIISLSVNSPLSSSFPDKHLNSQPLIMMQNLWGHRNYEMETWISLKLAWAQLFIFCENVLWTNRISSAFSWAKARLFGEWCTLSFHIQQQAIFLSQTLHCIHLQLLSHISTMSLSTMKQKSQIFLLRLRKTR